MEFIEENKSTKSFTASCSMEGLISMPLAPRPNSYATRILRWQDYCAAGPNYCDPEGSCAKPWEPGNSFAS